MNAWLLFSRLYINLSRSLKLNLTEDVLIWRKSSNGKEYGKYKDKILRKQEEKLWRRNRKDREEIRITRYSVANHVPLGRFSGKKSVPDARYLRIKVATWKKEERFNGG